MQPLNSFTAPLWDGQIQNNFENGHDSLSKTIFDLDDDVIVSQLDG